MCRVKSLLSLTTNVCWRNNHFCFQMLVSKGKGLEPLQDLSLINIIKINLLLVVVALMIEHAEDLEASQLKFWHGLGRGLSLMEDLQQLMVAGRGSVTFLW